MNWNQLKEEAKKIGAEVYSDVIYYSNLVFWVFGEVETQVKTFSEENKTIAKDRTPEQMWQIMEALR
jgi:hypothetical protein